MSFLSLIRQAVENSDLVFIITNLSSISSFIVMIILACQLIKGKIKGESDMKEETKNSTIALIVAIIVLFLCVITSFNSDSMGYETGTGLIVGAVLLIISVIYLIHCIQLYYKTKHSTLHRLVLKRLCTVICVFITLSISVSFSVSNMVFFKRYQKSPMDICILLGDVSNSKQADLSVLDEYIESDSTYIRSLKICVLDGDPSNNTYEYQPYFDEKEQRNLYVFNTKGLINKEYYPKKAETDILAGLWEAEKYLLNDATGIKKLVIFSSGISTKGYINFHENLTDLNDNDIYYFVKQLKYNDYLPDFSEVDVQWFNLGETEEPQQSLDRATRKKIEKIWTEVLNECGVEIPDNFFKYSVSSENYNTNDESEYEKYPYVTPIVFGTSERVWSFTEKSLQFVANKSTFLYPNKALATLKPYADSIKQASSKKYIIVGSTSGDGPEELSIKLSFDRAKTVKNILCEYGVPEERLIVYGIGSKTVGSENLTNREIEYKDGKKIESNAKLNRKVMIVDMSTELGQKLLYELEIMGVPKF